MPHSCKQFRFGDTRVGDEEQTRARHYREIAQRIRELARQARIAEIQEQLFDLADRFDELAADDVRLDTQ